MTKNTLSEEVPHPAILSLNELLTTNQIANEVHKDLLFKFTKLNNAFTQSCQSEQYLMRRTRDLNKELKSQKMTIENSATQQQDHRTTLSQLRQLVTNIQVELDSTQEQISTTKANTTFKLKEKEKLTEKVDKAHENQRIRLDPQKKQIQQENANLEEAILQRRQRIDQFLQTQRELVDKITKCEQQLQEIEKKKKQSNQKMLDASAVPIKLRQKSSSIEASLNTMLGEEKSALNQLQLVITNLDKSQQHSHDTEIQYQHVLTDMTGIQDATDRLRGRWEDVKKNLSYVQEKKSASEYELRMLSKMQHESDVERANVQSRIDSILKDIDQRTKETYKLEDAMARLAIEKATLESQLSTLKKDANAERQNNEKLRAQLIRTNQEFEKSLKDLLSVETLSKEVLEQIKQVLESKDKKQLIVDELVKKEHDFNQQLAEAALIRNRKAREMTAMKKRTQDIKHLVTERNLDYLDLERKMEYFHNRLLDISQLYEKVKLERNRYNNTIQTSKQLIVEFKEKIRILDNEVEVLRAELSQVDAAVKIQKGEMTTAFKRREQTKGELKKSENKYYELQRKMDYQVNETSRMNLMLQRIEDHINHQQIRYSAQADDCANIQRMLIDKQDELCIVAERFNRHEEVLKRGESALKEREEEIKVLNLTLNDFIRKIEILQKKIPQLRKYDEDIKDLKAQIDREQKDVDDLTGKLEVPDHNRKRVYCGRDYSAKELDEKIELYEQRISGKEQQRWEKQILLREITEKIDSIKAETMRDTSKAAKIMERGGNIRAEKMALARKKKAAISELTVYMAQKGELNEKKEVMKKEKDEALARTARGDAFDDYADKIVRMHQRDIQTAQSPKRKSIFDSDDEDEEIPPGRQKFDAYPTADGLSRPYGAFPVFQPQQPSGNLRFFKKEEERIIVV